METLRDYPLAAYCSYGSSYLSFRSSVATVREDIDRLLARFDAHPQIRREVYELLSGSVSPAAGFRYEAERDYRNPERAVVYATTPIAVLDSEKKTLNEVYPPAEHPLSEEPVDSTIEPSEESEEAEEAAWAAPAA